MDARALKTEESFYTSQGDEIGLFEAAYKNKLPLLLKGPTGFSETRFMEHVVLTAVNEPGASLF